MSSSEAQLRFRGRLYQSGLSNAALLKRLRALRNELAGVEQGAVGRAELDGYCKELIKPTLIAHKDSQVRATVACILADMLRLYAPDAPFSPTEIKVCSGIRCADAQKIFRSFVDLLAGLASTSGDSYEDLVYLLESLSTVKSVLLICELPAADAVMAEYFTEFLALAGYVAVWCASSRQEIHR